MTTDGRDDDATSKAVQPGFAPARLASAFRADVGLPEAIGATGFAADAWALLATPTDYHVARLDGGVCERPDGPVDLATVFEARVFDETAELRWLARADSGDAVLLAEDETRLGGFGGTRTVHDLVRLETRYLLWGEVEAQPTANGWARLGEGRLRSFAVPVTTAVAAEDRLALHAVEYVDEDAHGNAFVLDERLVSVEVADKPTGGQS